MVRLILWLKSSLEGWLGGNVTKEKKKKIDIEQFRVGIKFLLNFDCHIIILEF